MTCRQSILIFLILYILSAFGPIGAQETLSTPYGPPDEANTWQQFTVPLTAEQFDTDETTFQNVLSNVTVFRIRTEMRDGNDVGSIDQIRVGTTYTSDFDSGNEGWNAAGDGTMEWIASGGMTGGYLQISDWASGQYHYAVAPLSWAGDWSSLIGQNISFYFKTDYPSYKAYIEISNEAEKRLILAADNLSVPAGGTTKMSVTLSEAADAPVIIKLKSSESCFRVDNEISIPTGQTFAEFNVSVPVDAEDGCSAVITASATEYGDSRVTLRVGAAAASQATIKGRVTDATTDVAIANAIVVVAGTSTRTDNDGYYTLENIPTNVLSANFSGDPRSGHAPLTVHFNDLSGTSRQTITVSADGYIEYESTVTLSPGETKTVNVSLSPIITDNELRIVLNWGESPEDLDSHLLVPGIDGNSPYQVYYSSKGQTDDYPYAMLDIDKRNGLGPETITIKQFVQGRYVFFVHNYSREQPITASSAVVQIYGRSGLLHTITAPLSGDGVYWHICDIDGATGQVTIKNIIGGDQPRLSGVNGLMKTMAKSELGAVSEITSWQWDFESDGIIDATEQNPTHTYTEPGEYTVSLTVSDGTNEYTERKEHYISVTSDDPILSGYDVNMTGFDISNFPLVQCFVSITDAILKAPAEDLVAANFTVQEDNLAVTSLTVNPLGIAAKAKADIVFVFDVTGSMGDEISTLKRRALAFADSLASRGIDYRLALVTFSDQVEEIHDFTTDANEFKTWIGAIVATGGGDTEENALEGIESAVRLSYRENTQRLAILITDADYHEAGETGDGRTEQTTDSIIELLNANHITMNVIGPNMSQHKQIAHDTGGQYYLIFGDFNDIIDRISDYVTKQYVFTYISPNTTADASWRIVDLTIQNGDKGGQDSGTYYIGTSQLILNPPTILGRVENTFVLDVRAESVINMGMAHFRVTFDHTKVQVLDVSEGDFLIQGGASSAFVQEINNRTGFIDLSMSRLANGQEPGVSGSGLLAQITFKVLVQNCNSAIAFQTPDVRHPDNSTLDVTTSGASLRSVGVAGHSELLCDFDNDLDIDTRDFAFLGTFWKPGNNSNGDVGPATGAVPILTPVPDAIVNYEDLFVFTRMWNWYHAALLRSDTGLEKSAGDLTWQSNSTSDKKDIRLSLQLNNIVDLAMGHMIVHYDADFFKFKTAKEGLLLTPDASPVALLVEEKTRGELELTFSRLTSVGLPAGVSGTGAFLTLDFERLSADKNIQISIDSINLRTPLDTQIYVKTAIDNANITAVHIPERYSMINYPNPFNSRTTIEFQLPEAGQVKIEVLNILGQPVKTISEEQYEAGSHKLVWDGQDDFAREVVTGTYIVRMQAGPHHILRKILFLK